MWWSPIHPAFAPLIGALLISLFLYARYIKSTYGLAIIGVISILNAIRALAAGTRTYGLRRVKDDEWVHSMLSVRVVAIQKAKRIWIDIAAYANLENVPCKEANDSV